MMGQLIGNLLNVVLGPIMILVFDWGIAGAAVATVIENLFGAVYYILYFHRGNSVLSIHLKDFAVKDRICSGVLAIGIIGRRADLILRGRPNTCNIFITAPLEYCIRRVSLRDGLTEQDFCLTE